MQPSADNRPEFPIVFKGQTMEPAADVAPLGEVTFHVVNESDVPHDFAVVQATEVDPKVGERYQDHDPELIGTFDEVPPGGSRSATYLLDEGRYVLVSNTPGDTLGLSLFELTVQDPQGVQDPERG
jgi:hypothetical protein